MSGKSGHYIRGEEDINGFPHWIHENGKYAIWMHNSKYDWKLGLISQLGSGSGVIDGPNGNIEYPTEIKDGWAYLNGQKGMVYAAPLEIVFRSKYFHR